VQGRRANQAEIIAAVSDFTHRHTKQELLKHLGARCVRAGQRRARRLRRPALRRARYAGVGAPSRPRSRDRIAGVAIKMSETPGRVRHRAPLLGEHTDEYLISIGCSTADIARLRADKIVA